MSEAAAQMIGNEAGAPLAGCVLTGRVLTRRGRSTSDDVRRCVYGMTILNSADAGLGIGADISARSAATFRLPAAIAKRMALVPGAAIPRGNCGASVAQAGLPLFTCACAKPAVLA